MDPFVKIYSEHLKLQTKVHNNGGKKPKWEFPFNIYPDYLGDEVKFTVLDQDLAKQDVIGHCTIPKSDLMAEGENTTNLKLVWGPKDKDGGILTIMHKCKKKELVNHVASAMDQKFGLMKKATIIREQAEMPQVEQGVTNQAPVAQAPDVGMMQPGMQ